MSSLKSAKPKNDSFLVLALSIPLVVLIAGVSMVGIFSDDLYRDETLNWKIQASGQDVIDLILIIPVLISTTLILLINKGRGLPIWSGVILYIIYTFVIYSFDIHFNKLFLYYCLILGLAFYSFLYFSYRQLWQTNGAFNGGKIIRKVIGTYFILIAVFFYSLWLSEIIPAMTSNATPKNLMDVKLPTNPVHVLDLAVVLPGIFITGVMLLRNKKVGFVFAPVILVFFILIDITIGSLSIMMQQKGLEGNLALAIVLSALAFFSLVLLIGYMKEVS